MSDRYCIVIPHYRHHRPLAALLPKLLAHGLQVLIVDDASGDDSVGAVRKLVAAHGGARLITRDRNGGKGAAMMTGLRSAADDGYTHVISLDADGQHDPCDVPKLHALSRSMPASLISGRPVFGDDIPAARLYGRMLTNRLVQIVTGSTMIKDAMCGLRVYPLEGVLPLCERLGGRTRMEFDVEILVRACWAGLDIRAVDTEVIYPEDGESHFHLFTDNARLVGMHTLLILGGLARIPRRLMQK
jgi:glycosyltransferase involved in cell wall biosynthesis